MCYRRSMMRKSVEDSRHSSVSVDCFTDLSSLKSIKIQNYAPEEPSDGWAGNLEQLLYRLVEDLLKNGI
jgi:hypothetical protein